MESDKYVKAIGSHPFKMTDNEVKENVNRIISDKFNENNTKDIYKKIYSCIDLTTLNTTDTKESVWQFVEQVNKFDGSTPELENVAALCVYPNFVPVVKEALTANVKIAAVSAGFPSSQTFVEVKVAETALAVSMGADEIDVVINVGLFLCEDYEEMCEELTEIKETCRDSTLKVILETGALENASNIHKSSVLALYSGADFLKTSTGKGYPGATPEAVYVMCHAIKAYYQKTGRKIGLKVSGGVSTTADAVTYYTIMREMLGEEWCNPTLFRVGTSRLANTLLSEINTH
jgi:deoxyribose-phosphate aldolase